GALGGLLVTGNTIHLFSLIGILLLFGLVTKNSILLVDYANQLRRQGMDKVEAMRTAAPVRMRPVLMTALSMIFGALPAALGVGRRAVRDDLLVEGALDVRALLVFQALERLEDRTHSNSQFVAVYSNSAPGVSARDESSPIAAADGGPTATAGGTGDSRSTGSGLSPAIPNQLSAPTPTASKIAAGNARRSMDRHGRRRDRALKISRAARLIEFDSIAGAPAA
ncbi:MAG: efflux RND transporter permease subunit, partial [Myxococcales bacterium]|nr:efflux RND transporter permease subunit [Myxococcales bacterium]